MGNSGYGRAARAFVRRTPLEALGRLAVERLRRSAMLAEEFVPHEIHTFDRQKWVLKETQFGFRIWCSLDDLAICRPILLNAYERGESRFIEATVRPGQLAVDAGANIGYHALHLARLTGKTGFVEAFEPLPYLADALCESVAENAFTSHVAVHRAALGEFRETLRLRHAPRTANFGGAHLAPDNEVPPAHTEERVAAVRLDDIIGTRQCHFLKMDVEGAEPRVIRGARATLAASRPIILSELHDEQLRVVSGSSAADLIAQMSAFGYRCRRLNVDGTRGHSLDRYTDRAPLNVVFETLGAGAFNS